MNELIEQWAKRRDERNLSHSKLCRKLTKEKPQKINLIADDLHERVFNEIDCLSCANCCKSIPPILNENDIRRIAKYLGIKVTDFRQSYVKIDEDSDMVFKQSPCFFLDSQNFCTIYDYRPKACREYPHTGDFKFHQYLKLHPVNSTCCPAVFHMLEEFSKYIR